MQGNISTSQIEVTNKQLILDGVYILD